MIDETGNRMVLRQLQASVRNAIEDGIYPELVLDAVAAGLAGHDLGDSPLGRSLARAMYSSVGPAFGGSDPTEDPSTSAGPADVPPSSQGPHAPGPAEARPDLLGALQGAVDTARRHQRVSEHS